MIINVFGPGCAKCAETENIIRGAVEASGCGAEVRKISDYREMMTSGVMSTPAVAIDGKIMCAGRVPTRKEALEWIAGASKTAG